MLRCAVVGWLTCIAGTPVRADLEAAAVRFEHVAGTKLEALKTTLEAAGWPATHVQALLNVEIQRRLNPEPALRFEDLRPFEFWRTGPDALPLAHLETPARRAERAQREEQVRAKHDELFPPHDQQAEPLRIWEERRRWGNLPPAKRAQVAALIARAEQANDRFLEERGRMLTKDEWHTLHAYTRQARTRIAALLTADELLDYDLRNSNTAAQMREELDAFEPTREEFVAIFQLRHPLELQFDERFRGIDSSFEAQRLAAEEACNRKIAELLGAERYRDYEISLQPACQTLRFDGRFARVDAATIRALYREVLAAKKRLAELGRSAPLSDVKAGAPLKAALYDRFRQVLDEEGTRRYLQEQALWP